MVARIGSRPKPALGANAAAAIALSAAADSPARFLALRRGRFGADQVRDFRGHFESQFYESGILAIPVPGGLVEEEFNAIFFDGIDIAFPCFQLLLQFTPRRFRMAVQDISTNQVASATMSEEKDGSVVHLQYFSARVAHDNGPGEFLNPSILFHFKEG